MLNKVILPALLSPVVAGLIALTVTTWIAYAHRPGQPGRDRRGFERAQIVSASMIALAHGTNDAQKTMGVITLTLITVGLLPAHRPPRCGWSSPPGWPSRGHRHGRLADHPHAGPADQRRSRPRRASPPRRPAPR